jgi:hydrogenase-4 component F
MVALALLVVPLFFALVAMAIPSDRARPLILPLAGAIHLALTVLALREPLVSAFDGVLELDPTSKLILVLVSTLFFLCSFYVPGYVRGDSGSPSHASNRLFCAGLLVFLGMMTLVVEAHTLGLMWVAVEATTLASAPLIYYHRDPRALEATWKYLLICSVGIALALLGSFFLAYSALYAGLRPTLVLADAVRDAPRLSKPWLHSAFVLVLIGYGTKMGLAPMHTWLPDAHSEAPSPVSAMLSGALLNCAFLAILRFYRICFAAGDAAFAREMMIVAGLLSMAVSGVFMVRQKDYKRLLAYSSVEHMGILVLGIGIGGAGIFGSMLHTLNNGLTKGALFLTAGNLHRAYASKSTDDVGGALVRVPISGALFLAGFFAITGSPPFGPFLSEFTILNAAIQGGHFVVAGLFLLLLVIVFIGMGATVLAVVQGTPSEKATKSAYRDGFFSVAPSIVLLAMVLMLGLYIPRQVSDLVEGAAAALEAP